MANLEKARLFRLGGEKEPQVKGDPIPVQFNPSSMHVVISSATDGPGTPARQAEQSLGAGNVTAAGHAEAACKPDQRVGLRERSLNHGQRRRCLPVGQVHARRTA